MHHHRCLFTHYRLDNHHQLKNLTDNHYIKQQRVHKQWFERNSAHIRPNNLQFMYAVTPRSNNRKSFFRQSPSEQSPTQTVSDTIWFTELDPHTLTNLHSREYNPQLSYRKRADMPFESKMHNLVIASLHNLKDRVSEYFPPSI